MTETTKPVSGASTKETVKTIAQGRPDVTGEPVATLLVCFFHFARGAMGASRAPGFPCALCFGRIKSPCNSGVGRENAELCMLFCLIFESQTSPSGEVTRAAMTSAIPNQAGNKLPPKGAHPVAKSRRRRTAAIGGRDR
jgi:hypothetical protein